MQEVMLRAADGVDVPVNWFPASEPHSLLAFLPALGVQAKLYTLLGQALSAAGVSVAVLEQRGHGRSPIRPSRRQDFGLGVFLDEDIPLLLDWVQQQQPSTRLVMGGHSLGGHLSTIYSGIEPGRLAGVLHITCSFPYYEDFPPRTSRLIRLLCILIPVLGPLLGHYPGRQIGFGSREFRTLMHDWRDWALSGEFDFGNRSGLAQQVSSFSGRVLSIELEGDDFSAEHGVRTALSPFVNAEVQRTLLGAAEQGEFLGHFQWARQPAGVARTIVDWLRAIP